MSAKKQRTLIMTQRNQELANYLKPLLRLLKRWNNVHSKRLKSFHLELLTQATFRGLSSSLRENVQTFSDLPRFGRHGFVRSLVV
jgi:hypothetical protein